MTEHEEFDQIFLHVKQLTTVSLNFWFGCHLLVNSTEEFHRVFWCIVCLSAKLDPLFYHIAIWSITTPPWIGWQSIKSVEWSFKECTSLSILMSLLFTKPTQSIYFFYKAKNISDLEKRYTVLAVLIQESCHHAESSFYHSLDASPTPCPFILSGYSSRLMGKKDMLECNVSQQAVIHCTYQPLLRVVEENLLLAKITQTSIYNLGQSLSQAISLNL